MSYHVGQLLCGGFQGTSVTSQARRLIVEHHVSTLILSKKNALDVAQMTKLIRDLQHIARYEANYKYPLMIAIDEEGGMMNSLYDELSLSQFPGAMALAATGDPELVYEVSKALALQLRHIGVTILLGPVLDIITKLSHQLVGVRSFGTTLEEVTRYGKACARGIRDGGLMTFGKHFPGIGNASVDSLLELPMMADSLDQIKTWNAVPFAELIKEGLLDGVSAAGCGVPSILPDETHACLSPVVVNQFLRQEIGFDGVVVSECLEMDALYHSIGLGQGVILAIYAGCDLVMVCHDQVPQDEAVESMKKALDNGNLDEETILTCLRRIERLQKKLPSWEEVLQERSLFKVANPELWGQHQQLSKEAYQKLITLIRDFNGTLPIQKYLEKDDAEARNVLILSPLLNPVYELPSHEHKNRIHLGEEVFQKFGEMLLKHLLNPADKPFNVLHTTYTANGLTALHENLIEHSQVVIVLTSEASRNMYQIGIVKYVSILCGAQPLSFSSGSNMQQLSKPLVIVATLSPYDFFYNKSIGSAYLCCYDYTNNVLEQLVGVLMGDISPEGCIPGEKKFVQRKRKSSHSLSPVLKRKNTPKRRWLVDEFDLNRDWTSLVKLWKNNSDPHDPTKAIDYLQEGFYRKLYVLLLSKNQRHFVVRNSSLNILYGVILTWVDEYQSISLDGDLTAAHDKHGAVLYILVDKSKRLQSIGKNLHTRAIRYLQKEQGCTHVDLGALMPLIAFPDNTHLSNRQVQAFIANMGWLAAEPSDKRHVMVLRNLNQWLVPQKIFRELMIVGVRFDMCSDPEKLMRLIDKSTREKDVDNHKSLYMEAVSYLNNPNSPYEVKIIIALEPTNQNVIGSIVLFTNKSQLARLYPFVDEAAEDDGELVGAIMGPVIDPSYSNLTEIFKFGLICSVITFMKSSYGDEPVMKQLLIGGVDEKSVAGVKEIGFETWKEYYGVYDVKESNRMLP